MGYEIMMGLERPATVMAGYLMPNDVSRINESKGKVRETAIRIGVYGVPNYTVCWGRRVVNGKPKIVNNEEYSYDVDDAAYKGEIEPLKWLDPRGNKIDCRWVRGVESIDQTYQDLRLKVLIKETDEWASMIKLPQGYSSYNDVSDKALILFLKVHYYNENSIYKSPDSETSLTYREVRKKEIAKSKTKAIDNKLEGAFFVKATSEGVGSTQKLWNLYQVVKDASMPEIKKDDSDELYTTLLIMADEKATLFNSKIFEHKKAVSQAIVKAETYDLLDLTKDGVIAIIQKGKAKPLIDNIPAKGDLMKEWCFSNFLEPHVYDGFDKLKKIVDKI